MGVETSEMIRTAHGIDCRVTRVGDDECELGASMPSFRRSFWVCIIEVDGDGIIGWRV
jgi:hypothetical protein